MSCIRDLVGYIYTVRCFCTWARMISVLWLVSFPATGSRRVRASRKNVVPPVAVVKLDDRNFKSRIDEIFVFHPLATFYHKMFVVYIYCGTNDNTVFPTPFFRGLFQTNWNTFFFFIPYSLKVYSLEMCVYSLLFCLKSYWKRLPKTSCEWTTNTRMFIVLEIILIKSLIF